MPCIEFQVEMTTSSLTAYRWKLHGTVPTIYWDRLPVIQYKHLPQVYEDRFPRESSKYQCTFTGCLRPYHSRSGLSNHSTMMHLCDRIHILEDHPTPYPHCEICGHQVPPWKLNERN